MPFTDFNENVPTTGHSPSQDYTIMQANNLATLNILDVDHKTFNGNFPGDHKKCTFPEFVPQPPVGMPSPIALPAQGGVLTPHGGVTGGTGITNEQLYFANTQAVFMVNPVRAFGNCSLLKPPPTNPSTAPLVFNNSIGVENTCTQSRNGLNYTYVINLTPGVISSIDACVFIFPNGSGGQYTLNRITYEYTLTTTVLTILLTLDSNSIAFLPDSLNFVILQA